MSGKKLVIVGDSKNEIAEKLGIIKRKIQRGKSYGSDFEFRKKSMGEII